MHMYVWMCVHVPTRTHSHHSVTNCNVSTDCCGREAATVKLTSHKDGKDICPTWSLQECAEMRGAWKAAATAFSLCGGDGAGDTTVSIHNLA